MIGEQTSRRIRFLNALERHDAKLRWICAVILIASFAAWAMHVQSRIAEWIGRTF